MKIKNALLSAAFGVGLLSATGAHATLTLTLGGQGVYDSDLNITWLQNAHLAATNTFGVSGIYAGGYMNWYTAQSWIGAMNAANYLGYHDWRLPTTIDISNDGLSDPWGITNSWYDGTGDWGWNVTSSEMGHLYYTELGNLGLFSTSGISFQPGWGLTNTGPFANVQSYNHWSGTEYAPNTTRDAWFFGTGGGYQSAGYKASIMNVWAVRPGGNPTVISEPRAGNPAVIPEPGITALLLAGLGLLGFTVRRRSMSCMD